MNENTEFHIPFIKSLVFVAMVTIVSAGIVHYFSINRFSEPSKSPTFTSQQSQISPESPDEQSIRSVSH